MSGDMHQIYIDPIFIKGNVLRSYIWWDWKTRMEVRIEFEKSIGTTDRFKMIGFMTELMRRSGIDLTLTREQFINIQFGEFPGVTINVIKVDF